MESRPIRVLLVDDDEDDYVMTRHLLSRAGGQPVQLDWVTEYDAAVEAIGRNQHDVYLLDYSLGERDGLELLQAAIANGCKAPLILLTGQGDHDVDVRAMKAGAMDFLVKGRIDATLLERSIRYAVERSRVERQRERLIRDLEDALAKINKLRGLLPLCSACKSVRDDKGYWSQLETYIREHSDAEFSHSVCPTCFKRLYPDRHLPDEAREPVLPKGDLVGSGSPRGLSVLAIEGAKPASGGSDVTGSNQEEQLLHSQRMEAVGQLTGGVVHDLNNLLTAILGYSQMGMARLPRGDQLSGYLQQVFRSAERATELTRQLLTFSRRRAIEPKVIDHSELILDLDKMLRRLIGEHIELVVLPGPDRGMVKVDPGQMEQVLVNIVINARDAMPEGGKVVIQSTNVTLDESFAAQHPDVDTGEYVMLAVSDTGVGMTREVQARIFEPFFTTKEAGKGTGLGLSSCYSIVAQNAGHITCYSEPGRGTTFRVYLPRVETAAALPAGDDVAQLPRGSETVLLVEDEPLVREMAFDVLRGLGYTVLKAANGSEALRVARDHSDGHIDLVLTDVVMPLMGGTEMARELSGLQPEAKVLYTSGYTDDTVVHYGVAEESTEFMEKPFTPAVLALKVREVLEK